jgi:hypothetical protein
MLQGHFEDEVAGIEVTAISDRPPMLEFPHLTE